MTQDTRKKKSIHKRRIRIYLMIFIGLVFLLINSVYSDWRQILSNNKLKEELQTKYVNLLEEEKRLSSEVIKLQDKEYILLYAREKFGYSKDGELVIQIYSDDKEKSE